MIVVSVLLRFTISEVLKIKISWPGLAKKIAYAVCIQASISYYLKGCPNNIGSLPSRQCQYHTLSDSTKKKGFERMEKIKHVESGKDGQGENDVMRQEETI